VSGQKGAFKGKQDGSIDHWLNNKTYEEVPHRQTKKQKRACTRLERQKLSLIKPGVKAILPYPASAINPMLISSFDAGSALQ